MHLIRRIVRFGLTVGARGLLAAALLTACGGGGSAPVRPSTTLGFPAALSAPTPLLKPTPTPSPKPTPTVAPVIRLSPSALRFSAAGQKQVLTASRAGYGGTFAAKSGNSSVATVAKISGTKFNVTGVRAGSTSITVSDTTGKHATAAVSVTTTVVTAH